MRCASAIVAVAPSGPAWTSTTLVAARSAPWPNANVSGSRSLTSRSIPQRILGPRLRNFGLPAKAKVNNALYYKQRGFTACPAEMTEIIINRAPEFGGGGGGGGR